jgi:hypothetical protein
MYSVPFKKCKGFYTGVGSRETPLNCLYMMSKLAMIFEKKNYILRSGCAIGADSAFEDILYNPATHAEIYIPNLGFPLKMGTNMKNHYIVPKDNLGKKLYHDAMILIHSKRIHKAWERCQNYIMDLHNRNMFQVLGKDLKTKSKFTVCYTSSGEKEYGQTDQNTGGTATAINASSLHGVEVFNLGNKEDYNRLSKFIKENENLIDYNKLDSMIVRSDFNNKKLPYKDLLPIINQEELKKNKKRFKI